MEADFLREYNVHLDRELDGITWRKFMVLLRCLSPNAATVSLLRPKEYIGSKKDTTVTVVGKKNAEKAFQKLFSTPKRRKQRGSSAKPA